VSFYVERYKMAMTTNDTTIRAIQMKVSGLDFFGSSDTTGWIKGVNLVLVAAIVE